MFQFRRFPTYAYLIQRRLTEYCSAGFPHSVIHGSKLMCSSPWLIAACHDLLRLLMPRHSPCALISLTSDAISRILLILKNYVQITEKFNFGLLSFYPSKQLSPFIFVPQHCCFILPLLLLALHLFIYVVQFSRCGPSDLNSH